MMDKYILEIQLSQNALRTAPKDLQQGLSVVEAAFLVHKQSGNNVSKCEELVKKECKQATQLNKNIDDFDNRSHGKINKIFAINEVVDETKC